MTLPGKSQLLEKCTFPYELNYSTVLIVVLYNGVVC